MIVNAQALSLLFINLKTSFMKALDGGQPKWARIATLVPSTTTTEDYAWLGNFPMMKQWIGEKAVASLAAFKYLLANLDFETTIMVKRNDMEDDRIGIYATQAQSAGVAAAKWPDQLVFNALNSGFTARCFDGQYFFDTDHPGVGLDGKPTVFSNFLTKKLSIKDLTNATAGYGAARTALLSMLNDQGQPLDLNPNLLVVPPALADVANTLMTASKLASQEPNPYKGTAEVVVSARLTNSASWVLMDTNQAIKPFVFQQRKAPTFVQQIDPDSDDVFMRAEYKFGAEARGNAGFTFPQLAVGSTGADALV